MKVRDVILHLQPEEIIGKIDINNEEIRKIFYDSRKAEKGSLFVAIRGFKEDGHEFIREAYEKGVRVFVVEKLSYTLPEAVFIKVLSTRKALAQISSLFYHFPSRQLRLVGITGTNGKTTITYLLESIFKRAGVKTGRISTINYDTGGKIYPSSFTTPESLDLQRLLREMVDNKVKYVFMEVSSHSLVLKRVEEVEFDFAVFTNLSPEHLDFHSDMENYLSAKMILFKTMLPEKKSLINIDDDYGKRIITETSCRVLTYGIKSKADYRAKNVVINRQGSFFEVEIEGKNEAFECYLPGIHNVYNSIAAVGVAREEKIPSEIINEGLKAVKRVPGRLELVENKADLHIYVDYAHTPHSLEGTLLTLRRLTPGRLIVVFGCGGDRDPYKRPMMGKIAFKIADYTILTSDNPRSEDPEEIISQIEKGMIEEGAKKGRHYSAFVDRREAIAYGLHKMKKGDTLLIAGKGHEKIQIFKNKRIPFSDVEVVKDLLKESG